MDALCKLALAQLAEGNLGEGEATVQIALRKDPKHANARYLAVRLALAKEEHDAAKKLLDQMVADGQDGYAVRMKLADIAEAKKDEEAMKEHLHAAYKLDTSQAEPLQALYDLAHEAKDEQGQLWALRNLSLLDQHDRRVWRRLLALLVESGKWKEARKVGESAIYVDVTNPEMHWLYGRALARTGNHISAIYEMNSALIARPKPKRAAEIYRAMASGYEKLGRKDYAERCEKYAKEMESLGGPPEEEAEASLPLRAAPN